MKRERESASGGLKNPITRCCVSFFFFSQVLCNYCKGTSTDSRNRDNNNKEYLRGKKITKTTSGGEANPRRDYFTRRRRHRVIDSLSPAATTTVTAVVSVEKGRRMGTIQSDEATVVFFFSFSFWVELAADVVKSLDALLDTRWKMRVKVVVGKYKHTKRGRKPKVSSRLGSLQLGGCGGWRWQSACR